MRNTQAIGPKSISRHVLPNGLVILAYQNVTTPSLVARLAIKTGAMFDPPEKAGLASFAVRAIRRGTVRQNFEQLNEATEGRGASIGLDAGQTLVEAGGKALREDTSFLLSTIAELILEPSFPVTEIEKLREQLRTGLVEMESDTGSVAEMAFRQALYPTDHPFHYRTAGFLTTLDNIGRDDMVRFHRDYFRPDRAVLVVVGDIDSDDIVSKVEHLFGKWRPEGTSADYYIPDVTQPEGRTNVVKVVPGKTQNDLVLGFPSMRRRDPDFYAFDLMNLLLGRIGLMGRLGKTVRDEQGLAYYAGSSFEAGIGAGPWAVRAGVNPVNVEKAITSILGEIERIRNETIPEGELEGGKRFLTGVQPLRLETSDGIARAILEMELHGLGFDYVSRYPEIVNAISAVQVQKVAQQRLSTENYVATVAGPAVTLTSA